MTDQTTVPGEQPPARTAFCDSTSARAREVLDLVADKWSLLVVAVLGSGPLRFTEAKRSIAGVSQRMLTVTLRGLERDGLLTRTVHSVMPPKVTYELTPMGHTLLEATQPLIDWSMKNLADIDASREAFDQRAEDPPQETLAT
ncbi:MULTISPECIES: winged helix-turn-helix transcriptional regulator [unclassified Streptomyces]|uniref:winged helix-turn-helix transcriptional regulator n=1 Tax=unclassified Streptomyces TaxID=2593676 RepID=UPI0036E68279